MRTRALARVAVSIVLVAAAGCASYRLVHDDQLNTTAARSIEQRLTRERELKFTRDVPIVTVSAAEARALLERQVRREYTSAELATMSRVYAAAGLLPPGTDLEKAVLQLYGSEVAGFYDPIDRRMVLVTDAMASGGVRLRLLGAILGRDLTGELILGHELTHALQDQHFGLNIGKGDVGDDDAELARRAVYEGDATLAGYAVVMGGLGRGAAGSLAAQLAGVPAQMARTYPDMPAMIRDTLTFQYVAGVNFVSWAYEHAGWNGVNALLARPPRSTEQILHPEKYFEKPEYPLAIRVGGIATFLGAGWELSEDTTLGELVIRVLVERFSDTARARTVAAGWDGDRLVALTHGNLVGLIWMSSWDTENDAIEFERAYGEIQRRKSERTDKPEAVPLTTAEQPPPPYLERRGTRVLAIEGPLQQDLTALADDVWRHTSFEAVMPFIPIDVGNVPAAADTALAAR